ncbi:helix-turn-helix domain-containing protein [Spirosoma gilvum]
MVAQTLNTNCNTLAAWAAKYQTEQLRFLTDKPRSGRPILIEGSQRAQLTALACEQAPAGHSQWSLRLLARKAVELGYCEHLSHTHLGDILKKTSSSPILNASGASVR